MKNNFKLFNGKQQHEFKLALMTDGATGLVVRLDKHVVKGGMILLMEDLRFYSRSRVAVDIVWGLATNLYEW